MEFRRIENLPPYVFSIINGLKIEARRAGADVVDLGFGNPDIPSPQIAVDKLAEAAQNPKNHRYSLSRGLPKLREAIAGYYKNKWDVDLDPELEITNTIGSKEGFSHLMWVLLDRGDAAIVPSPSYPIHIYGPLFAGADLRQVPMRFLADPTQREHFADDFMSSLQTAWDVGWPKPRVLVISFPHNPTGATVDLAFMQRVVDFCREHEMIVVHDFAYADVGFNGQQPPSILQAEGAKECEAVLKARLRLEVVPGVPAAVGVPAFAGVAVGLPRTVARVEDVTDWRALAAAPGALVLLGTAADVAKSAAALVEHGRKPGEAVAVTVGGTTTEQRTVVGTLDTIETAAAGLVVQSPSAQVVVVHRRQVVVDQAVDVDRFDRCPDADRPLFIDREQPRRRDHDQRTQFLAAANRRVAHRREQAVARIARWLEQYAEQGIDRARNAHRLPVEIE